MTSSVTVNDRTVVHRQSGGFALGFPDVCITPPNNVPVPYLNLALVKDADGTCSSVLCDGFPVMKQSSYLSMSYGDEPGELGGVVSGCSAGRASPGEPRRRGPAQGATTPSGRQRYDLPSCRASGWSASVRRHQRRRYRPRDDASGALRRAHGCAWTVDRSSCSSPSIRSHRRSLESARSRLGEATAIQSCGTSSLRSADRSVETTWPLSWGRRICRSVSSKST